MHCQRVPSRKITCRTVQVLPECLRLSTIPAVRCNVAAKGFSGIQNKLHSPTEYHPVRKRNSRSMCADFAAHGRSGLSNRECHGSRQCNSLQCSLVHGSGRLFPTLLTELDRRARGTRPQDSQDKQNNKRIQGQAIQKIREGREEVTAGVCVMMGPAALCNPWSPQLADNRHSTKTRLTNGVQRGVPDHPRANTSVQERKAPEQHPQHTGKALLGGFAKTQGPAG